MKTQTGLALFAVLVYLAAALPVHAEKCEGSDMVTVTGDAEVLVVPDQVVLTSMVETWNPELSEAKKENDKKVKAIIELARKMGVEDKYIQTDRITVEPRYNEQWEHKKFIGFFVRKSVAITLNRISSFEDLLSGVLGAGANYVQGTEYRTTELRKNKDAARVLAVNAAKEKAQLLAKELGRTIGQPHMIQEVSGGNFMPGASMLRNVAQNSNAVSESGNNTALGQIAVSAGVTVSFELQ